MNELFEAIGQIKYLRFLASIILAVFHAVLLSTQFEWFTDMIGMGLVAVGFVFGMVWEGNARYEASSVDGIVSPLAGPATAFGFSVLGFVWGNLFASWMESALAAGILLGATPFVIGAACARFFNRGKPVKYLMFYACYLVAGFAVPYALKVVEIHSEIGMPSP